MEDALAVVTCPGVFVDLVEFEPPWHGVRGRSSRGCSHSARAPAWPCSLTIEDGEGPEARKVPDVEALKKLPKPPRATVAFGDAGEPQGGCDGACGSQEEKAAASWGSALSGGQGVSPPGAGPPSRPGVLLPCVSLHLAVSDPWKV